MDDAYRQVLARRGFILKYLTLAWNVVGIVVLAVAAIGARSVALAGFGLDSLIEIGASTVVIWELSGTGEERQRRGLHLIGYASRPATSMRRAVVSSRRAIPVASRSPTVRWARLRQCVTSPDT